MEWSSGLYCKCFMILIYNHNASGQYYKPKIKIVIDDPSQLQPQLVLSIMIVSDSPNCGITYDRHYDDRNSFIVQATGFAYPGVFQEIL